MFPAVVASRAYARSGLAVSSARGKSQAASAIRAGSSTNRALPQLSARRRPQPECSAIGTNGSQDENEDTGHSVDHGERMPLDDDSLWTSALISEEQANEFARGRMVIYLAVTSAVVAEPVSAAKIDSFLNFSPVCPAADVLFRAGQQAALAVAGDENIENYRPLINDVLIRLRTEICVLESFIRETATPFIQEKGLGWVLPLRETSETYLAGVVFMVGANFILLGSTKVVAILSIYADILVGLPARLLGKLLSAAEDQSARRFEENMDKLMTKQMDEVKLVMKNTAMASEREKNIAEVNAKYNQKMEELKAKAEEDSKRRQTSTMGKASQVAVATSVPLRIFGQTSLTVRQVLEIFDTFCSRYFVTFTVTYIIIKTVHFVFLPDFP